MNIMKCFYGLALSIFLFGCNTTESTNIPLDLLGKTVKEVQATFKDKVYEGDFVDEDESDVFTQEWVIEYIKGRQLSVFTDDGIVSELKITSPYFYTNKGIRVGDTLEQVKKLYPKAFFKGGSLTQITSSSLFLYSADKKITFVFDDVEISSCIDKGMLFDTNDERIKEMPLWGFYIKSS